MDKWTKEECRKAEELICQVEGVGRAQVIEGTNGRPLNNIYVTADARLNPKYLVRIIEALLKNTLDKRIDYRIVSINKSGVSK